jgi:hypothetical protein
MLSESLTTNEIKKSDGTEVEFRHQSWGEGMRKRTYAAVLEAYNYLHRFWVSHQEISSGIERRRRSAVQFSKEVAGVSGTTRKIVWTLSGDIPVGDLASNDEAENVLAELLSFVASTGSTTTILYDCSGNGAKALIDGSL